MSTNFTSKFASSIVSVLGCHDWVIFKGHLPFGRDSHLNDWVDRTLKMRRKDFIPLLEKQSVLLVDHAKTLAQRQGASFQWLPGKTEKEKLVHKMLLKSPRAEGLVTVLQVVETCRGVKLLYGKGRPRLAFTRRQQSVLYYYFLDPEFGLMHVRLQTWFPYAMQVYVNGHHWLACQMQQRGLGFVQRENAFTQLDDPVAAQKLADRFPKLNWPKLLDRWTRLVNPLANSGKSPNSRTRSWLGRSDYYWVIDQAEYSTDVLFKSRDELATLYPRLLNHAVLQFSAQDILTFLGRRLHHGRVHPSFTGEILTDCKKDRLPGARIKHRMKNNWLKMYDKFGQILRVETVINQPREFRVRRRRMRKGRRQTVWCPMNKGVANFYHYHAVARASNERYLNALCVVKGPHGEACAATEMLDRVSRPAKFKTRRRRALNLLHSEEQRLFLAILRGEWRLNGFRNRDVVDKLYGPKSVGLKARRRRSQRVCRQLQLLRAHGLIAKVPHSHRYRITETGEAVMSGAVQLRVERLPETFTTASEMLALRA